MTPWLRYTIAFVVGCHGFTYIPFGILVPGKLTAWKGNSWLLGGALTGDRLKGLMLILHVMAGIAILSCAVAIAFAPSAPGWWPPLAIIGGILGVTGFAAFYDGQVALLIEEGGIGLALSLILLVVAVMLPGMFG